MVTLATLSINMTCIQKVALPKTIYIYMCVCVNTFIYIINSEKFRKLHLFGFF